ncbi:MAG: sulfatase [Planctomycetes bacterium]|nr:sulfatase [Planctomycetota bacterium]
MSKPHIIYMHSHDTGRFIQPQGYAVPTPNLQKFAQSGSYFRNNFCIQPCCSASRAALLTGTYPHENGMFGLAHRGWSLNNYNEHIIHTLHDQGYTSALSGVQHVTDFRNGEAHEVIGYKRKLDFDHSDSAHEDADTAAVKYLAEEHTQPFFLAVGFVATHRDFLPATEADDPRYIAVPPFLPDTEKNRQDMADYHASARYLDAAMQRVLQAVDDNNLTDNTIIIITTDHGIPFPYAKCNLTDHGLGTMLMMRGPGIPESQAYDAMTTHMDIFPTLCEILDIEKPSRLRGSSLLPLFNKEVAEVHDYVFGEVTYHAAYEPMRSIRSNRHKLIVRYNKDWMRAPLPNCDAGYSKTTWLDAGWADLKYHEVELYDLIFDPIERQNLVNDPAYQDIKNDLLMRLDEEMKNTNDPLREGPVPMPSGAEYNPVDGMHASEKPVVAQ